MHRGRRQRQRRRRQIHRRGESGSRARRLGYKVGLLDADIYGPSVPMMFGTGEERPRAAGGQIFYPVERFGVKLISIGFFLNDKSPVIWRGPMVMGAVRQFLKDTLWGTQDFLIVDLPPGTGDAQLTLAQQVAIDGAVIVTTPQDVALADALRAVRMFRQVHCPLLGRGREHELFRLPGLRGSRRSLRCRAAATRWRKTSRWMCWRACRSLSKSARRATPARRSSSALPDHPASQAFIDLARRVAAAMPQTLTVTLLEIPDVDADYRRMHQLRRMCCRDVPTMRFTRAARRGNWMARVTTPLAEDIYYIVPGKCTECVGFFDHEECAAACPVDCCIPDPEDSRKLKRR